MSEWKRLSLEPLVGPAGSDWTCLESEFYCCLIWVPYEVGFLSRVLEIDFDHLIRFLPNLVEDRNAWICWNLDGKAMIRRQPTCLHQPKATGIHNSGNHSTTCNDKNLRIGFKSFIRVRIKIPWMTHCLTPRIILRILWIRALVIRMEQSSLENPFRRLDFRCPRIIYCSLFLFLFFLWQREKRIKTPMCNTSWLSPRKQSVTQANLSTILCTSFVLILLFLNETKMVPSSRFKFISHARLLRL